MGRLALLGADCAMHPSERQALQALIARLSASLQASGLVSTATAGVEPDGDVVADDGAVQRGGGGNHGQSVAPGSGVSPRETESEETSERGGR